MSISSSSSPSSLTFLTLFLSLFFLLPPPSSSIKLTLRHVDSGKNLTKLQRLQHGLHRSQARLHRFDAKQKSSEEEEEDLQIQSPVFAGTGAYLMTLSIGTPPLQYPAVLDTGSDLIWTQCLPCSQCYAQPTPFFDPTKSSSFKTLSCSNTLCSSLPSSSCTHDQTCNYVYSYGDYSSTQGILASETFTFGSSDEDDQKVSVLNIAFGCGEDNEGDGFNQASGLVGLGRGPLSFISQHDEPRFSYCLTSMDESESSTSTLFLGSFPSVNNVTLISTSLLKNPSFSSFYYLPLEGISVGETRVEDIEKSIFKIKEDGSGGVIIDSGTTITYLEQSAYEAVKKEFVSQTNLKVDTSGSTGLDLCFSLGDDSESKQVRIPKKLVFHFGASADLEVPSENFLVGDTNSNVVCLAMGASRGLSIFGNIQQQNVLVNYDLQKEAISFAPMRCDKL